MTFSKAIQCGCTGKSIYSGFIQTMQFVEKQHTLTLKALILQTHAQCLLSYRSITAMTRDLGSKRSHPKG